ncbi:hypothetical protein [Paenibacillus sp. HB172176]|uniref:hypothetical protein n=1 Tax=Paenibacillus sp. HB172176 TaxID=2493690 RepID=UPI001438A45C|nr:hypothetical protein [Paenibacillus sp. HB172176]
MNNRLKRVTQIMLVALALGGVMQLGTALASAGMFKFGEEPAVALAATSAAETSQLSDNLSAPASNESPAITSYAQWLDAFHVHETLQQELSEWMADGHKRSDMMIGFTFLYHQYGMMSELLPMVEAREAGASWAELFSDYVDEHGAFEPRAFDMNELESLTSSSSLSADDIMIADRISFVSGESVKELLALKLETNKAWQDIATERSIVNGSSELPRVQITEKQFALYSDESFSEDRVAQGFVLANKLGTAPEAVIASMKEGHSETEILAEALEAQYESY